MKFELRSIGWIRKTRAPRLGSCCTKNFSPDSRASNANRKPGCCDGFTAMTTRAGAPSSRFIPEGTRPTRSLACLRRGRR